MGVITIQETVNYPILDADMSEPIKQPFTCLICILSIAPNRLFDVVATVAAEDQRDAQTGPGEALVERQAAAVALLAAVTRCWLCRPLSKLRHGEADFTSGASR